jgi:tRNA pseudouridine38-40 synthase
VHASQYFFHLEVAEPLRENLQFVLNKTLPDDIAIYDIWLVSERLHARYSARARSYDYFIHRQKDPFLAPQSSLYVAAALDLTAMQQAVALLPRYQDYAAFCRQPHLHNNTLCRVQQAQLYQADKGQRLRFHLTANRFLRGQIRILVRKLLDVGLGKYSVAQFEEAFQTGQRPATIFPAHPQGLFLSKVVYEGLEVENRSVLGAGDWVLV